MRLKRSSRQGRPSRSRIVGGGGGGGGGGSPARDILPRFKHWYNDLYISTDRENWWSYTPETSVDDVGIAALVNFSSDGSGATSAIRFGEKTTSDPLLLGNDLAKVNHDGSTYDGHHLVGWKKMVYDYTKLYTDDVGTTGTLGMWTNFTFQGASVNGDPTLVDSGMLNVDAGWTIDSAGQIIWPEHDVPEGYTYLYFITKDDNHGATTATWSGTAAGSIVNTLAYDTAAGSDGWWMKAYRNGASTGTLISDHGAAMYTDVEDATRGGAMCSIVSVPGTSATDPLQLGEIISTPSSSTGVLVRDAPTTTRIGDLMVCFISIRNVTTITNENSWTVLGTTDDGTNFGMACFAKIATQDGDHVDNQVSYQGNAGGTFTHFMTIPGASITPDVAVNGGFCGTDAGFLDGDTSGSAPGVTTNTDGALVVASMHNAHIDTTYFGTWNGTFTLAKANGSGAGGDCRYVTGQAQMPTAGATVDPITVDYGTYQGDKLMMTVAFKKA